MILPSPPCKGSTSRLRLVGRDSFRLFGYRDPLRYLCDPKLWESRGMSTWREIRVESIFRPFSTELRLVGRWRSYEYTVPRYSSSRYTCIRSPKPNRDRWTENFFGYLFFFSIFIALQLGRQFFFIIHGKHYPHDERGFTSYRRAPTAQNWEKSPKHELPRCPTPAIPQIFEPR